MLGKTIEGLEAMKRFAIHALAYGILVAMATPNAVSMLAAPRQVLFETRRFIEPGQANDVMDEVSASVVRQSLGAGPVEFEARLFKR